MVGKKINDILVIGPICVFVAIAHVTKTHKLCIVNTFIYIIINFMIA